MQRTGFRLARILALIFMLGCLFVFLAGVAHFKEYAATNPDNSVYSMEQGDIDRILSQIGLSFAWWVQYQLSSSILIAAVFCIVGGFIFFRGPQNTFGLLVAVILVMYGTLPSYAGGALKWTYPSLAPVLDSMREYAWALFFFLFYLFPDGRFVPRWTRWAAFTMMLLFTITIFGYGTGSPPAPFILVAMLLVVIGMGSQVYRYRKAVDAIQRQQMKWILFAIILLVGILVVAMLPQVWPGTLDPESPTAAFFLLLTIVTAFSPSLIPLAIGLAILRYRLWDIDVIIRRTLVWTVLTGILGLVYFGGVTLFQAVFASVSQQRSPFAIVLSTLAIAALFNPLRKRVQEFVDRRFYRRKYNAEQALASFAALAREEVDLEEISERLLAVVEETVQPESVSLWLRPAKERQLTTATDGWQK